MCITFTYSTVSAIVMFMLTIGRSWTLLGLLVGYSEISKAYRVYIPARRRIIVSRDVQFNEDRALRRSLDLPAEQQSVQVQVQTQSRCSNGQRESGTQDPLVIDLKDELQQETNI